jgi:probable HAF family extracellular repeat protein
VLYSNGGVNDLGTSGGSSSTSEAINKLGQVTGTYEDSVGSHAFLYSGGSMVDLQPGRSSFVSGTRAINEVGAVAGTFQADQTMHGFVYVDGHATDIGTLGADYTVATAISDTGKLTGISARADGERHAFIYSAGTMADVGTLGGNFSVGYALNDSDQVAGESMTSSGALHAFVSESGTLLDLGELVETLAAAGTVVESVAVGINRAGQVVGRYTISDLSDVQMPKKTRGFIATSSSTSSVTSLLENLIASVVGVGPGKSLVKKLQQALTYYIADDIAASCSSLGAFSNEVNAQDGKKINHQKALQLIQQVGTISGLMGCP